MEDAGPLEGEGAALRQLGGIHQGQGAAAPAEGGQEPEGGQAVQGGVEGVASDRIEHGAHAAAARDPADLGGHLVIGGAPGHDEDGFSTFGPNCRGLLLAAHHADDPAAFAGQPPGQHEPHAPRRGVDQDPGPGPGSPHPPDQHVRRQALEEEGGRHLVGQARGQRHQAVGGVVPRL